MIKFLATNCASLFNKRSELEDLLFCEIPDVVAITETWCHQGIGNAEITFDGYSTIRSDRWGARPGGVALMLKSDLNFRRGESLKTQAQIEGIAVTLILAQLKVQMLVVYRPPSSAGDADEHLTDLVSRVTEACERSYVLGDFNAPGVDWDMLGTEGGVFKSSVVNLSGKLPSRQISHAFQGRPQTVSTRSGFR